MDLNSVGALLYWCEGSKRERDRRVEFVNSDPRMILLFMKYLRSKGVDEGRIRVRMMLHLQDDEVQSREYWKSITSLADSNFVSSVFKKSSIARKHLPHGTIAVRYNFLALLREVNRDISNVIATVSQP